MVSGDAIVRKVAGPNASLEERVAAFEDNLRLIDERISSLANQLRSSCRSPIGADVRALGT
jgi:hypothetical protein